MNVYRHFLDAKATKRRNAVVATLSDFMFIGQTIRADVPPPHVVGDPIIEWVNRVTDWRVGVSQYLAPISARAEAAFSLVIASQSDGRIHHNVGNETFYVTGVLANAYVPLVSCLNNLRGIMEKPEAYF